MTALLQHRQNTFVRITHFCRVLRDIALASLNGLKQRVRRLRRHRGPPSNAIQPSRDLRASHVVTHPTGQCVRARRVAIAMLKAIDSLPPDIAKTFAQFAPPAGGVATPQQHEVIMIVLVAVISNLQTEDLPAVEWLFPWLFCSDDIRDRP